jgi:hypothetical protein
MIEPKVGEYWNAENPDGDIEYCFLVLAESRFKNKKCWLCVKCTQKTRKPMADDPQDHPMNVRWFNESLQSGDDCIGETYYTLTEKK